MIIESMSQSICLENCQVVQMVGRLCARGMGFTRECRLNSRPGQAKCLNDLSCVHGPLTRYVKFWVAHGPGMAGTFSPPPRVSDPDMHHGTCVTHVPWCMLGSLSSGFLWSRWRRKRSLHFRRMRNPQFYLSGKSPWMQPAQDFPRQNIVHIFSIFVTVG